MMNIQNEVQKIHNQYGMSEKANYKIQLLCEQYAKEYHESEVKKLNIPLEMFLQYISKVPVNDITMCP